MCSVGLHARAAEVGQTRGGVGILGEALLRLYSITSPSSADTKPAAAEEVGLTRGGAASSPGVVVGEAEVRARRSRSSPGPLRLRCAASRR
jgi:hypothetical protein